MAIKICGWEKHQHYKDKRDWKPPWIKVYRDVLGDHEIMYKLKPEERFVVFGLWLLAAETNNNIPCDIEFISDRLKCKVTMKLLELMRELGILTLTGESKSSITKDDPIKILASEEKSKKEEMFVIWWNKYAKKRSMSKAKATWLKMKDEEREACIAVVDKYVRSTPDKQFRKDPTTYLNQQCWNDDVILDGPELKELICDCGKVWSQGISKPCAFCGTDFKERTE